MGDDEAVIVDCRDCTYSKAVDPDRGRFLAEVLVEHVAERDHELAVTHRKR